METQEPPIRIIVPGRTFRCDSDLTHTPMFHQVEGLVIDKTTHMGHLKGCLIEFCRAYFEVDDVPVRFRPSYFRSQSRRLRSISAAPAIARASRLAPETIGWRFSAAAWSIRMYSVPVVSIRTNTRVSHSAWVERIAMLKYGIPDLRTFFEADLRWLRHYGFVPMEVPTMLRGLTP